MEKGKAKFIAPYSIDVSNMNIYFLKIDNGFSVSPFNLEAPYFGNGGEWISYIALAWDFHLWKSHLSINLKSYADD